ncbi:MAG: hypothetical protein P8N02_01005 [Actinomycetota bacterium]|jgi:hypothetical protein|nr:hypothetical protein [Actinomycetota bacterium]
MDPFEEMEREQRGRRILTFSATMALLLFVGFAVFPSLLGNKSERPEFEGQVAAIVVDRPDDAGSLALAAGDAIETFEVFGGKNPFTRPLSLPTSAPDPSPTTTPGATDPATPTTTTTPGGTTNPTPTTVPAAPNPSQQQPTRGQSVALLDVFDDADGTKAQIKVGSTAYLVGEGDVFATSYKVVSLDLATGCGRFLFGDSVFELCKGQEILK